MYTSFYNQAIRHVILLTAKQNDSSDHDYIAEEIAVKNIVHNVLKHPL